MLLSERIANERAGDDDLSREAMFHIFSFHLAFILARNCFRPLGKRCPQLLINALFGSRMPNASIEKKRTRQPSASLSKNPRRRVETDRMGRFNDPVLRDRVLEQFVARLQDAFGR